jgi:anti-sigma regulatory factor (Ser/Thr protein kinase)
MQWPAPTACCRPERGPGGPQFRDIDVGCDGMRSGAARGHTGNFHEVGFYASDAEFRSLIVPFAEEGIAAGEPVVIGYDDRKSGLLRSWLSDPSAVEFIADDSLYATPARAIATYERLFEFHLAMGAAQIRIAGDVPHPGNGRRFEGWDRYECAVNTIWGDFPVWSRCLYDTATAPAVVLDAAERTHPRIVSSSGDRHPSGRYQTVSEFQVLSVAPDPLEQAAPVIELTDSSAAGARHALTQVGRGRVPGVVLDDLLLGTSEAVNNAALHGQPPTTVRIWAGQDRIVVHVHDRGAGPANPLAGLIAPAGSLADAEVGLWLTHQLGIDVALTYGDDGFTVRLRSGPSSA